MKRRLTILMKTIGLVGLILSLLLLPGWKPSQAVEPVKIGAVFTQTGWAGFLGTPQKEAVEVEVDKINRQGGVLGRPIEVYYEDDQSNPTTSVIATTKLIRDIKVCAVLGTAFTSGASSMIPIAEREGVLLLPTCPATVPFNKWVFFVLIDDTLHGPGMLKFMAEDLKAKKITVLTAPEVGFRIPPAFSCIFVPVMVTFQGGLRVRTCRVCRVKRITCRLKSDRGSSAVRPRSLREV